MEHLFVGTPLEDCFYLLKLFFEQPFCVRALCDFIFFADPGTMFCSVDESIPMQQFGIVILVDFSIIFVFIGYSSFELVFDYSEYLLFKLILHLEKRNITRKSFSIKVLGFKWFKTWYICYFLLCLPLPFVFSFATW